MSAVPVQCHSSGLVDGSRTPAGRVLWVALPWDRSHSFWYATSARSPSADRTSCLYASKPSLMEALKTSTAGSRASRARRLGDGAPLPSPGPARFAGMASHASGPDCYRSAFASATVKPCRGIVSSPAAAHSYHSGLNLNGGAEAAHKKSPAGSARSPTSPRVVEQLLSCLPTSGRLRPPKSLLPSSSSPGVVLLAEACTTTIRPPSAVPE